jgi:DUF2924 family protein
VTVNAEGRFDYEGRSFKSLTAVARHITGQHSNFQSAVERKPLMHTDKKLLLEIESGGW